MSCNASFQNYVLKLVNNTTSGKVQGMKLTIRIRAVVCNMRLEVTICFSHLHFSYIKCILVSEIVIWLGSCRIPSPDMENVENCFKIDVIRPGKLPFIQEEMMVWWISVETAIRTDNNAGFLSDDHDLTGTSLKRKTPTNLISYDRERKTSICYDIRSSNFKDVYEKMPSNLNSTSSQANHLCSRF